MPKTPAAGAVRGLRFACSGGCGGYEIREGVALDTLSKPSPDRSGADGDVLTCGAVGGGGVSERCRTVVNATRTATERDLLAWLGPVPLESLPGDGRDAVKVPITMQQGQPL